MSSWKTGTAALTFGLALSAGADALEANDRRINTATGTPETTLAEETPGSRKKAQATVSGPQVGQFAQAFSFAPQSAQWRLQHQEASVGSYYKVPREALLYKITMKESAKPSGNNIQFVLPMKTLQHDLPLRILVTYDYDGSGHIDRSELYHVTWLHANPHWQPITHTMGIEHNRSYGQMKSIKHDGIVTLALWVPEGLGHAELHESEAFVQLPFDGVPLTALANCERYGDSLKLAPPQTGMAPLVLTL